MIKKSYSYQNIALVENNIRLIHLNKKNWIRPEIYAQIRFGSTQKKNQLKSCDGKSCIDMKIFF